MASTEMNIVFLGLSITSSWGNGHATTYRALIPELVKRGHSILFLERDVPWYAKNRDLPSPPYGTTRLYQSIEELHDSYSNIIKQADAVIVGSYVPQGVEVGLFVQKSTRGVIVFYDIDTPVTLSKLRGEDYEYIHPDLIPGYHLYLSFTGGPILRHIEQAYGAPKALPLYCTVDPQFYRPLRIPREYDLGYLGTYSPDRQPTLQENLIAPAHNWSEGRFIVAGPQYPDSIYWPANIQRLDHLPPADHMIFYNSQRFTLNITRAEMIHWGYSPSVRLFEAAACGTPIITDYWDGLNEFFKPEEEILIADNSWQVMDILCLMPEDKRLELGRRARQRILKKHTAAHRAAELEKYILAARDKLMKKVSISIPNSSLSR